VGSFSVTSDAAGNLSVLPDRTDPTNKADRLTYDFRNRLLKVERTTNYGDPTPAWTTLAEYLYDGLNRRVKKDLPGEGIDVIFLYDGWRCIEEREDDNGWEARRQYVFGGQYLDEVLIFDTDTDDDGDCTEGEGAGSTRYLYCTNNNFNVMALTDASGAAVERVKYDPYGQPTCTRTSDSDVTTASHFANPWLFQGQRFCSETGIYYFKNRDQRPDLGQFMQRDPLGYTGGMSLYQPLRLSPLRTLDALGLVDSEGWHPHGDPKTTVVKRNQRIVVIVKPIGEPIKNGDQCCQKFQAYEVTLVDLYAITTQEQHYWKMSNTSAVSKSVALGLGSVMLTPFGWLASPWVTIPMGVVAAGAAIVDVIDDDFYETDQSRTVTLGETLVKEGDQEAEVPVGAPYMQDVPCDKDNGNGNENGNGNAPPENGNAPALP